MQFRKSAEAKSIISCRHALVMGLAVSFALGASVLMGATHSTWIFLSAFLLTQMQREAPLRQGLIMVTIIILALIASFLLKQISSLPSESLLPGILLFLLVMLEPGWYLLLFFVAFLIGTASLTDNIVSVVFGALLVLFFKHFVFTLKWDSAFSSALLPTLNSLHAYAGALRSGFLTDNKSYREKKYELEKTIQCCYPEWVYTTGFNPGLRQGLRFFTVNLDRLLELHFSLQYIIEKEINPELVNQIKDSLIIAMEKNQSLLNILINYFSGNAFVQEMQENYAEDIGQLEEKVRQILPADIDLLDIAPDYLLLSALARDIKETREVLLRLVMSLQGEHNEKIG